MYIFKYFYTTSVTHDCPQNYILLTQLNLSLPKYNVGPDDFTSPVGLPPLTKMFMHLGSPPQYIVF